MEKKMISAPKKGKKCVGFSPPRGQKKKQL